MIIFPHQLKLVSFKRKFSLISWMFLHQETEREEFNQFSESDNEKVIYVLFESSWTAAENAIHYNDENLYTGNISYNIIRLMDEKLKSINAVARGKTLSAINFRGDFAWCMAFSGIFIIKMYKHNKLQYYDLTSLDNTFVFQCQLIFHKLGNPWGTHFSLGWQLSTWERSKYLSGIIL